MITVKVLGGAMWKEHKQLKQENFVIHVLIWCRQINKTSDSKDLVWHCGVLITSLFSM